MKHLKTIIVTFTIITAITATCLGFVKLPQKVAKIEEKVGENEDKVDKLATNMDKFLAVQKVRDEQSEEHKHLLMKLLDKMVSK